MSRAVKEWRGKTDDSKVPDHVRLRIFRAADGICHISGTRIRAGQEWHVEHVVPLSMGGEHRESNLKPALVDAHKEKSAEEAAARAKADAVAKRNLGIGKSKQKIGRGTSARDAARAARRQEYASINRRSVYGNAA